MIHLDVENIQNLENIQNDSPSSLNPLKKIGGVIRKTREEKNLSIEDLSGSLRIGEEQLIALENGEEDLLPEKVFIKAMIRRVAERLHLDLGILLNEFKVESLSMPKNTALESKKPFSLDFLSKVPTWALITGLLGITTSGFAITYLNKIPNQSNERQSSTTKLLAPSSKAIDSSYHIVTPGQTLSTISKFHEIPLTTLIKINELNNPDKLKIGTKLSLKDNQRRNIN